MVPRLWSYQVELPARTVLHLALGISIGALLILKLVIVRFFKHMEAKLVPALGVGLFLCSFLLIALVLPFSLREAYLESTALGDESMIQSRIKRVRELLPTTGLEDETLLADLASKKGLIAGRLSSAPWGHQPHPIILPSAIASTRLLSCKQKPTTLNVCWCLATRWCELQAGVLLGLHRGN